MPARQTPPDNLQPSRSLTRGTLPTPPCSIELLISEFNYHVAYKRWNDTFSAVPFKPK